MPQCHVLPSRVARGGGSWHSHDAWSVAGRKNAHRSCSLAPDAEPRGFFQLHLGRGSFPQAWEHRSAHVPGRMGAVTSASPSRNAASSLTVSLGMRDSPARGCSIFKHYGGRNECTQSGADYPEVSTRFRNQLSRVHHRGKKYLHPLNLQREKSWPREGVFGTAMGQSEAREPAGSHCAHPQSGISSAAAAEPLPDGNLEVTFTQSHIFPGLQILHSGCNQAICSWTEELSGD